MGLCYLGWTLTDSSKKFDASVVFFTIQLSFDSMFYWL